MKNVDEGEEIQPTNDFPESTNLDAKDVIQPNQKPEESTSIPVNTSEAESYDNADKNSPLVAEGSPATSASSSFNTVSTKTTFDHAAALRSIGKGVGKNLRSRTASMNLSDAEIAKLKKSKSAASKKLKKPNKRDAAFKDLGRWKPTDDLALIWLKYILSI